MSICNMSPQPGNEKLKTGKGNKLIIPITPIKTIRNVETPISKEYKNLTQKQATEPPKGTQNAHIPNRNKTSGRKEQQPQPQRPQTDLNIHATPKKKKRHKKIT